jgi:hypothetical protein
MRTWVETEKISTDRKEVMAMDKGLEKTLILRMGRQEVQGIKSSKMN